MRNLICVMLVVFLPLTLASQTQKRFKIAVDVLGEDDTINTTLESHLKRELRLLGDVDIVEFDENWHSLLEINSLEVTFKDGRKTGEVALSYTFVERIPDFYFKALWLDTLKALPVYVMGRGVAINNRDTLDQFCVNRIGKIDKNCLMPARKLLR